MFTSGSRGFQGQHFFPPLSDPFLSSVTLRITGEGTVGGTTFTDDSGKNTLTTHGSAAQYANDVSMPFGTTAIKLGSSSYITAPTGANFQFGTGAFTIECWVNATSLASLVDLLSFCNVGSNSGVILQLGQTTGKLAASTYTNQFIAPSGTGFTTGTWHQVCLAHDASNDTMRLFLDGKLQGSVTGAAINASDGSCALGATLAPAGPLTGYMKDIRVTKGVCRYTANYPIFNTPFPLV